MYVFPPAESPALWDSDGIATNGIC